MFTGSIVKLDNVAIGFRGLAVSSVRLLLMSRQAGHTMQTYRVWVISRLGGPASTPMDAHTARAAKRVVKCIVKKREDR